MEERESRIVSFHAKLLLFVLSIALLMALLLPHHTMAQGSGLVTITAAVKRFEIKESELVSNVIKVNNNSGRTIQLALDASLPPGWRIINSAKTVYSVRDKDSLFVPFRIMPKGAARNNTEYMIEVIAYGNGVRVASTVFACLAVKKTDWDLSIEPSNRIYFLNGQKKINFGVRYSNNADHDEEVLTTFKQIDKKLRITDSAGNTIENYQNIFKMKARQDTLINFNVTYLAGGNNQRRIDIDNHLPNSNQDEQRFLLFLQSTEANKSQDVFAYKKNEKVELVKLASQKKINPYSSDCLPLIVENNVFNVLGSQPIMYLNMRGNTILQNNASVFYYMQTNYTTYYSSPDYFKTVSYYAGYFDKKGDIQIGDMSGAYTFGYQSFGRGVKGSYNVGKKMNVGAFILRAPNLSAPAGRLSYGTHARYNVGRSDYTLLQISQTENKAAGLSTLFLTNATHITLSTTQNFTLSGGTSIRNKEVGTFKRYGTFINFNYSAMFLKKRLISVSRLNNLSRSFGENGSGRFYAYQQTDYTASDRVKFVLQNNFTKMNTATNAGFNYFNNQLFVNLKKGKGAVIPSAFYNTQNNLGLRRHFRGLGFDYNFFESLSNIKISTALRMGYNKLIDYPSMRNFFAAQFNLLAQYKNISFTTRYYYGPTVIRSPDDLNAIKQYPQTLFASLQHQYLFKNEYFVLQNNLNFSHYNQFYSNTIGYFPELYFFTASGWRFRAGMSLSVNASNPQKALQYQNPGIIKQDENPKATVSSNLNLQFGIRKEFGIPIPNRLTKKRFVTIHYTCYMDLNGNRRRDKMEPEIENVVIRTGDDEVMTDARGSAEIQNITVGKYDIYVMNLGNSHGWFPVVDDSMLFDRSREVDIPFVKGTKITGQVYVQRERYALDADDELDLSRIVVTATDSTGHKYRSITKFDGTFEMFVPNARYIIHLDADVWGDQFSVVSNDVVVELNPKSENTFISFQVKERQRKLQIKKF